MIKTVQDWRTDAIDALSGAARYQHPSRGQVDFADFLAHVQVSVSADIDGYEQRLARRAGSWAASYVESLISGTVGRDPQWLRYRTEPVVVPINVAQLIEDEVEHPGLQPLDEALADCEARCDLPADDEDGVIEAGDPKAELITARYMRELSEYAAEFATAVLDAATQLAGGSGCVQVAVNNDPRSAWFEGDCAVVNPDTWGTAPIVYQLWETAHRAIPLPNVDVRPHQRPAVISGPESQNEGV